MPTNLIYDEATGKYYDDAGNEVTITDGAPVGVQGQAQPDALAPEAETPTTVVPAETTQPDAPAPEPAQSSGQLLDVAGSPTVATVRYTEKEATDTEPAQYRDEVGNLVVGGDGALRFAKLETQEGGQA